MIVEEIYIYRQQTYLYSGKFIWNCGSFLNVYHGIPSEQSTVLIEILRTY
jgi:mannose-1-phosphate guanylyltransferase